MLRTDAQVWRVGKVLDKEWCEFRESIIRLLISLASAILLWASWLPVKSMGSTASVLAVLPLLFTLLQNVLDFSCPSCIPGWIDSRLLITAQGFAVAASSFSFFISVITVAILLMDYNPEIINDAVIIAALVLCTVGTIFECRFRILISRMMWKVLSTSQKNKFTKWWI